MKNNFFLTVLIILIIGICIITAALLNKHKQIRKVISCQNSKCGIYDINGLKKVFNKIEFPSDDIMQCNVEGVYKKDVNGNDVVVSYELFLILKQEKGDFVIQSGDGQQLAQVCESIRDAKDFHKEFDK